MQSIESLAEQITDRLMTNGNGDKATRLVLELPGGRDGGGLCRRSVTREVLETLETEPRLVMR
jgi:hypothetical protein